MGGARQRPPGGALPEGDSVRLHADILIPYFFYHEKHEGHEGIKEKAFNSNLLFVSFVFFVVIFPVRATRRGRVLTR
jgi:hypothetical protein